ncbi:MAG: hypothetical protein Tsb006_3820 [Rickettsiaceae bacterium]
MTHSGETSIGLEVRHTIATYDEMKGHLKDYFDAFVRDPEGFGATPEVAEEIRNMNSLKAKGLWVLFKQQFKLNLVKLEMHDLAELLNQDLAEDGVVVASKDALKRVLKHPENPEYMLEPEMIEAIKAMGSGEKEALMAETANILDLGEFSEELSHGQKLLHFLKGLWDKITPALDKIFDNLVDLGLRALGKVIDEKLPEEVGGPIKDALNDIGDDVVDTTIGTIGEVIEAGASGSDVSAELKEGADELLNSITGNTTEAIDAIVDNGTDKLVDVIAEALETSTEATAIATDNGEATLLGLEAAAGS